MSAWRRTSLLVAWLAGSVAWLASGGAQAHPMAPASLALHLGQDGAARSVLRATPEAYPLLSVDGPEGCTPVGALRERADEDAVVAEQSLRCERPPTLSALRVEGLTKAGIDAVVRLHHLDGRVEHALVSARGPLQIEGRPRSAGAAGSVFERYSRLGFEHLWTGTDHILFVLCLLLLAGSPRGAVWGLSAFTVGHALTLSLAALDVVRLPQAPAEVLIAASLVWMAGSVLLEERGGRHLALAGAGFGLVHGLGFASVLLDVGLPAGEVPLSLLAFNLGIELGQLLLALGAWVVLWLLRLRFDARRLDLATAYGVASLTGVLGAFWVFARL